jgi:hypothetical protein
VDETYIRVRGRKIRKGQFDMANINIRKSRGMRMAHMWEAVLVA